MSATANVRELPVANRETMRDFLANFIAEHIHLVAMKPDDDQYPVGQWFGPDADGAATWASTQNAIGKNVYWTVNRTREGLNKKPKKTDIVSARFAHVDLDPPKDGSPWDRAGALNGLTELDMPPSFVLDSGGGFGVFWRLEYAAENWPAIELLNQSLEDILGGDHCHNIDRLMRVPGTMNYPNAKKRSAGRGVSFASIAVGDEGEVVDPEDLRRWLPAPQPRKDAKRERVALEGVTVTTPTELGITTLNKLLLMIERPSNPDRSADTWAVACEMMRQGFNDGQIASILLNPALPISASPLEKPSPMREVQRTIGGARRDVAFDPGNRGPAATGDPSHDQSRQNVAIESKAQIVSATPYAFRLPETIKPREWVYGRSIQRGHIRAIVAQGGAGKTILSVGEALAMVTGRTLLGQDIPGGPKRVWLWNLEDDGDELARIIQAACKHWQISEADIGGRLFVDSALDGATLKLATSTVSGGLLINRPFVAALTEEMKSRGIDYLHVDPFVSSHAANENDNMEIDAIAKEWAMVAKNAEAGIGLAHHISKAGAVEASAMHARGAVALINACRSVMVLNRMSEEEAKRYGIEDQRRRRFFRVYDDKNNRAPPSDQSDWYQMASVSLGNDPSGGDGDNMGVVLPWSPPDAFEGVTANHLRAVQAAVASGTWRHDPQADAWVGLAVAGAMGFALRQEAGKTKFVNLADKVKAAHLVSTWIQNDALRVIDGKDSARKKVKFVEVGEPCQDGVAPPTKGGAEHGRAVEPTKCSTTTPPPMGVGGGAGGASGHNQVEQDRGGAASPASRFPAGNPVFRPIDEDDPAADAYDAPRTVF